MALIKKILLITLFYIIVFKPELSIFPTSVSILFGFLGWVAFVLFPRRDWKNFISTKQSLVNTFKFTIPFFLVAIVSSIVNSYSDYYFVRYSISVLCAYFSNYMLASLMFNIHREVTVKLIIRYFVIINSIYLFIALMMFICPVIRDFFISKLNFSESDLASIERTEGLRLQAFGISFFNAGVIEGYISLLISLYIAFMEDKKNIRIIYILLLIVFFVISLMLARTSLIGSCMAFMVLIFANQRKFFSDVFWVVSLVFAFFLLFSKISINVSSDFDYMINWAFEMFINFIETGHFETNSSNITLSMYSIIPDNIRTWLIGDGLWMDFYGIGYYKGTDVGFLRIIWYFGLVGLLSMIVYLKKYTSYIFNNKLVFGKSSRWFYWLILLYVILMNCKGFADVYFLSAIFLFCTNENNTLTISRKNRTNC